MFDENFKPIKHYYLGNADEIAAKAAAVANQGKAKCIGWDDTDAILRQLANAVKARRG
jgi:phospho-2-dehydro-3-deoxyheptonate aldolase